MYYGVQRQGGRQTLLPELHRQEPCELQGGRMPVIYIFMHFCINLFMHLLMHVCIYMLNQIYINI